MDFKLLRPIRFGKPTKAAAEVPNPIKVKKQTRLRLAALKEASEVLAMLPGEGESLHAVMTGRYDLTDVLHVLLERLGRAEHLRIATLSFNGNNIERLRAWLEAGTVGRLSVLYSEFFAAHTPETVNLLRSLIHGTQHRMAAARNHCKVCCLDCRSGRKISLEGSANLRTNSNQEQFALIDGPELHDWHAAWIDERITRHEVIQSRSSTKG